MDEKENHSFTKGAIYMAISAGCLSLAYLFAKLSTEEIPFFLLLFLRFTIPWSVLVVIMALFRLSFRTKAWRPHFIRTLFILVAQYGIFYYISKGSLLNATVLLNTSPLFIPIIEWLFLRHHVPRSTWISVVISALGVILLLQPDRGLFSYLSFIGLLSGFSMACSQLILGQTSQREPPETTLFYVFGFGTILSFFPVLFVFLNHPQFLTLTWSPQVIGLVFLLSLSSLMNQYFRGRAYAHKKPSTLTTFLYLSVLLSGFFDWFVFKHLPNTMAIVGALLVILGGISKIALRYLFLKRRSKKL